MGVVVNHFDFCLFFCILILIIIFNCLKLPLRFLTYSNVTSNVIDSKGEYGQINKLTSVFNASVLLLIMNFVITLLK